MSETRWMDRQIDATSTAYVQSHLVFENPSKELKNGCVNVLQKISKNSVLVGKLSSLYNYSITTVILPFPRLC